MLKPIMIGCPAGASARATAAHAMIETAAAINDAIDFLLARLNMLPPSTKCSERWLQS
jgi:hypothetical protein